VDALRLSTLQLKHPQNLIPILFSKVKQGGDERATQTVQPVRPGTIEEANAVSPMK
jgi:hypothetical protein